MARKDLGLLTRRVDDMKSAPADAEPTPAVATAPAPVAAAPAAPAAAPRKPGVKKQPRSAQAPRSGAVAEDYERKETWLRPDQQVELDQLAKRLQRAKDPSEKTRITANTIIRVAVDALLEHADELQGNTEAQIRESVTSRVTDK
ncbi:hypothetical protein LQ757_18800 [Agromyces sp. SYSU K20354]|uniref:hypothetical protein n=1 Tax=Agromyces cavernae TaxID=2898659 RepID=UPI001E283DC7|nr:hypothetical protein [Agromyces cavernae]MCD2444335.1 hypothetical protein [Agromyces cavernae]